MNKIKIEILIEEQKMEKVKLKKNQMEIMILIKEKKMKKN